MSGHLENFIFLALQGHTLTCTIISDVGKCYFNIGPELIISGSSAYYSPRARLPISEGEAANSATQSSILQDLTIISSTSNIKDLGSTYYADSDDEAEAEDNFEDLEHFLDELDARRQSLPKWVLSRGIN